MIHDKCARTDWMLAEGLDMFASRLNAWGPYLKGCWEG
jgi:hypothetical protein